MGMGWGGGGRYEFPLKVGEEINIATSACNELQTPLMVYFVKHLLGLSRGSGVPAHQIGFGKSQSFLLLSLRGLRVLQCDRLDFIRYHF